jgi:hypothetical protein
MGRCLIIFVHYISYLVIYCSLHYIHPCPCNTRVLPITVSLNVYIYTSVPSLISLHILSYYSYSNIRLILCAILLTSPTRILLYTFFQYNLSLLTFIHFIRSLQATFLFKTNGTQDANFSLLFFFSFLIGLIIYI